MEQVKAAAAGRIHRILAFVVEDFMHTPPAMVFFAVAFNFIVFSMNLLLSQYFLQFGRFTVATMAVSVVGKAMPVADTYLSGTRSRNPESRAPRRITRWSDC